MTEEHQNEIAELVDAQLDGTDRATDGRLRDLLRNDPDAQAWYVEYCQLHAMLAWEHGGMPSVDFASVETTRPRPEMAVSITRSARRWQSLAIAASLLFLVSAGLLVYDRVVKPGAPVANTPLTDRRPLFAKRSRPV